MRHKPWSRCADAHDDVRVTQPDPDHYARGWEDGYAACINDLAHMRGQHPSWPIDKLIDNIRAVYVMVTR